MLNIVELPDEKQEIKLDDNITAKVGEFVSFSTQYDCPECDFVIDEIEPKLFSFNTPDGACRACNGLGTEVFFKEELIVPDENVTLAEGAIEPWHFNDKRYHNQMLIALSKKYNFSINVPYKDLPSNVKHILMYGSNGEDIGFVGEIDKVNPKVLNDLLDNDYLPVVCPVGYDDKYDTYNINADDAACAIAKALKVEKLAYLSDVPGVYRDPNDKTSLIYELPYEELTALIESGAITGGMLPKLLSCKDAIDNGVSRVHIMDGRLPHCLLLEIFTNQGIGTAILSKSSHRFYNK